MHTSPHTATVAALADESPDMQTELIALVGTIITSLPPIEQHIGALRDAHALSVMDETDEDSLAKLGRLPPFVAGVLVEIGVLRTSAARIAQIVKELGVVLDETRAVARGPKKG